MEKTPGISKAEGQEVDYPPREVMLASIKKNIPVLKLADEVDANKLDDMDKAEIYEVYKNKKLFTKLDVDSANSDNEPKMDADLRDSDEVNIRENVPINDFDSVDTGKKIDMSKIVEEHDGSAIDRFADKTRNTSSPENQKSQESRKEKMKKYGKRVLIAAIAIGSLSSIGQYFFGAREDKDNNAENLKPQQEISMQDDDSAEKREERNKINHNGLFLNEAGDDYNADKKYANDYAPGDDLYGADREKGDTKAALNTFIEVTVRQPGALGQFAYDNFTDEKKQELGISHYEDLNKLVYDIRENNDLYQKVSNALRETLGDGETTLEFGLLNGTGYSTYMCLLEKSNLTNYEIRQTPSLLYKNEKIMIIKSNKLKLVNGKAEFLQGCSQPVKEYNYPNLPEIPEENLPPGVDIVTPDTPITPLVPITPSQLDSKDLNITNAEVSGNTFFNDYKNQDLINSLVDQAKAIVADKKIKESRILETTNNVDNAAKKAAEEAEKKVTDSDNLSDETVEKNINEGKV